MIVNFKPGTDPAGSKVQAVVAKAERYGLKPEIKAEEGTHATAVLVWLKDDSHRAAEYHESLFETMDGVSHVERVSPSQVSAAMNGGGERHQIRIGPDFIGANHPCLAVLGPCSVDNTIGQGIEAIVGAGFRHCRLGIRKPRSRALAFRGFGTKAMRESFFVCRANGVESIWLEVVESVDIDEVRRFRDQARFNGTMVLWVGARNGGNYRLLEALGQQHEFVVMLKNGLYMTNVEQLMEMAEWVLYGPMWWQWETGQLDVARSAPSGNNNIIFCVRGLAKDDRERYARYRFRPNLEWITELHERSWAPVCYDPMHISGELPLVWKYLKEGLEFKPDVVLLESHPDPKLALSDRDQAIPTSQLPELTEIMAAHNAHHYQRPV